MLLRLRGSDLLGLGTGQEGSQEESALVHVEGMGRHYHECSRNEKKRMVMMTSWRGQAAFIAILRIVDMSNHGLTDRLPQEMNKDMVIMAVIDELPQAKELQPRNVSQVYTSP